MRPEITVVDGVTPTCKAAERSVDAVFYEAVTAEANKVGLNISREYDTGQNRWPSLSPKWLAYKAMHGYDTRILHMTNQLQGNVWQGIDQLPVSQIDSRGIWYDISPVLDVYLTTPYVWAHEFADKRRGGSRLPKRDFIARGIRKTLDNMERAAAGASRTMAAMQNRGVKPVTWDSGTAGGGRFQLTESLSWVAPPSRAYAVFGAISDVRGFMMGSFFKPGALQAYLTAYARARTATSRKVVRRRVRRGIHRGR